MPEIDAIRAIIQPIAVEYGLSIGMGYHSD